MYIRKTFLDDPESQVKLFLKILEMNLEESSKDEKLRDSWERLLQGGGSLLEQK